MAATGFRSGPAFAAAAETRYAGANSARAGGFPWVARPPPSLRHEAAERRRAGAGVPKPGILPVRWRAPGSMKSCW